MTSTSANAVFLSYASQDIVAARSIAQSLRATGMEVWLDENELTSGDAWDAKIREQIRSCALFIPVISASTEQRLEGYFRREWKLAVERTHDMAEEKSFLVPVVIDGTAQETAHVPAKFREYQWTRLPAGATSEKFVQKISALLNPPNFPSRISNADPGSAVARPAAQKPKRYSSKWIGAGLALLAAFGVAYFWPRPSRIQNPTTLPIGTPMTAIPPAPLPSFQPPVGEGANPELKRALELIDQSEAVSSDTTLAEDLVKSVLNVHPTDTAATIAMARVQVYILLRGYDRSEERYSEAKNYCTRALTLAPHDPDAMAAMATYLFRRNVDRPQALRLTRAAIAAKPNDPTIYRLLDNILSLDPSVTDQEVIASALITAKKFPKDAIVQYELARHYRDAGMLAETEQYLNVAVSLAPVANATVTLAELQLFDHGNLPGMRRLLDEIPERSRSSNRAAIAEFIYAEVSGKWEGGIDALSTVTTPWMIDFDYTGPTALLWGELFLAQGKLELAKIKFQEAQAEMLRHPPDLSKNFSTLWLDSWILMRLGRMEEARARNAIIFADLPRPFHIALGTGWWTNPIPANLLLGEPDKAIQLIREASRVLGGENAIRTCLQIDPRMKPFRDDPKILAAIANPADAKK